MKKDPFNQIIKKWPPKGVFFDLLEKYLGMNVRLWGSVCVCVSGLENVLWQFLWCLWTKKCVELLLLQSSYTDYEFSAAILIFNVLMWNVYYYHEILADTDRQENYKRLVAYGFHSWQINWYLTPKREKLVMKTSIATRLHPICSWFCFDPSCK